MPRKKDQKTKIKGTFGEAMKALVPKEKAKVKKSTKSGSKVKKKSK